MPNFPDSIYSPRTVENRPGVDYDATKTKRFYAEDLNGANAEIVALENFLKTGGGWIPLPVPTRQSADDPVFVLRFSADMTSIIGLGSRIKFTQNGTVRYFIVVAVGTYSGGNTDITVYGGTDYDVLDTATYAITSPSFSIQKAPFGFPLDPTKWTIESILSSDSGQSNPTNGTIYNLGSFSINIPIGIWHTYFDVLFRMSKSTSTQLQGWVGLSTANNSFSDSYFKIMVQPVYLTGIDVHLSKERVLNLATKATYYLNAMSALNSINNISFLGGGSGYPAIIRAVCAYL